MSKYPKMNGALTNYLPSIPDTADGLPTKRTRSFIDAVYDIYRVATVYAKIRPYLVAVRNSEAVEGNVKLDIARASIEIQDYARKNGITEVANANLNKIGLALSTSMRRDKIGRNQRLHLALEGLNANLRSAVEELNANPPHSSDDEAATAAPAE